jgi:uncharacterized membrane protein
LLLLGHSDYPESDPEHISAFYNKMIMVNGSLLLLNFLIAIFSDSVGRIMRNKIAISTVQKLCILAKTEKMFRKWPFVERLYQYQRERYFDVVNGRLLLRVETDE